jgi:hypothetical protein
LVIFKTSGQGFAARNCAKRMSVGFPRVTNEPGGNRAFAEADRLRHGTGPLLGALLPGTAIYGGTNPVPVSMNTTPHVPPPYVVP